MDFIVNTFLLTVAGTAALIVGSALYVWLTD